jgi:hypothetical protein
MAGQSKQSSRNRKIEPLNWAETANSPALKGMMSFLDITSEEVRSGHFKDVPQDLVQASEAPDAGLNDASVGVPTHSVVPRTQTIIEIRPKLQRVPPTTSSKNTPVVAPAEVYGETPTGSDTSVEESSDSPTGSDSLADSDSHGGSDSLTESVAPPISVSPATSRVVLGSVPSQNRKIRKCRLSQDGHSAGEEMLYRVLWEEGRPETANPLGSRLVRIGYAELANKARLHKANVRLNLASLTAKLAIEQNGDFNSRDMIAKAYRVLSYKEILERRRAAGLEFVIRQKNVVFVTESGDPIPLAGLPLKNKSKQRTDGAQSPAKTVYPVSETPTGSDSRTVSVTHPVRDTLIGNDSPTGSEYESDLACVSKAFNTFWAVDDVASEQLLRACRKIRPDAEAEEIAFFVVEKLELTRANRSITNPVGLILATVPQSFSGHSFEIFRQRRRESLRLAKEEAVRKADEDRMMNEWMIKDAKKTLANPSSSEKQRRHAEEVLAMFPQSES